jgi:type IV secretory pathway TrbF-like protein
MKAFLVAAACGIVLALGGCSGQVSGTARGLFIGYVTDKTEEEVAAKVGKPESVEPATPTTLRWTYKKKTFDPDNQSLVDNETILIFQKDASGKFKVVQVIFG